MTKSSNVPTIGDILDEIEQHYECDIVAYNGPISEDGYGQFVQACKEIKPERGVMLALVTYGGSADSAYRIARYAQNFFKDFMVFVPGSCKSAGTLISLGASKIFMSPFGELGPLDVQISKADEIFERRSGLLSKSAVWSLTEEAFKTFETILINLKLRSGGTISFKVCSQVAASITTGLLSPIAAQLDPLSIGEDYQNLHIAHEYGKKLITKFNVIDEDAVSSLVELYPSHGFVIDIFEANDLLGNVEMADESLVKLHACFPILSSRPNLREAHVARLRDLVGEKHEREDAREAGSFDEGPSSSSSGGNQKPERENRSVDQEARKGPNGNSAPVKRGAAAGNGPDASKDA
jgi:hypothetical protein